MLFWRQISFVEMPASCCLRIETICVSVNRVFFISLKLTGPPGGVFLNFQTVWFLGTLTVLKYLKFRRWQPLDEIWLSPWLLNKGITQIINGEQPHNLRLYLWFGSDGIIRRKQEEQQQKVVRSLNLMTNIILVWNTVYQPEIIKQLHKEG